MQCQSTVAAPPQSYRLTLRKRRETCASGGMGTGNARRLLGMKDRIGRVFDLFVTITELVEVGSDSRILSLDQAAWGGRTLAACAFLESHGFRVLPHRSSRTARAVEG